MNLTSNNPTPTSSPQTTAKLMQLSLHQQPAMYSHQPHHSSQQPDEGYSEAPEGDTHSDDTDMSLSPELGPAGRPARSVDEQVQRILTCISALPLAKRKEVVQALIPGLPNSAKEDIRALIEHLTHFDPTIFLPNEIVLQIFSYLTPRDLLVCSRVSRAWRIRARDEKLWRACFAREGWVLNKKQIEAFEAAAQIHGLQYADQLLRYRGPLTSDKSARPQLPERRESRKRGRDEAFDEGRSRLLGRLDPSPLDVASFDETIGGSSEETSWAQAMEGIQATSPGPTTDSAPASLPHGPDGAHGIRDDDLTDISIEPPPFQALTSTDQAPKISWPYLYKQRRRLESNWENGKYKMFQLPDRDHPEEGHDECVYTIQHTDRHLVSGSRDKTIRIWDLATLRLKRDPLLGHTASVLCLQFDERPEHDVIISGGSDALVIIWRFSTGEIIKKLMPAHEESVLNLRFDERYLVTCSKDKTIKLWNRHKLTHDSPLIPTNVIASSPLGLAIASHEMIAEYSLLATFIGHQAAVNAVMIHENTIVSASGDRTIKSWDIKSGRFYKNYGGHEKGIACVQFDGRRIVSGSSDNTIRIFDAQEQAEVACLDGHSNLVRTIQARFGDLDTVTAEELAQEAKRADIGYYAALARGMQPANVSRRHGGTRNAGSSRPEDMLAVGTKVPPGGGGSRWAKIVSGSYDETIILWKRDRSDGKWTPRLQLHQDAMSRGQRRHRVHAPGPPQHAPPAGGANATAVPAANPGAAGPIAPLPLAQTQAHHHIATAHGHLAAANDLLHPTGQQDGTGYQVVQVPPPAANASNTSHGQASQQQPTATNQGANAAPQLPIAQHQAMHNHIQPLAATTTAAMQQLTAITTVAAQSNQVPQQQQPSQQQPAQGAAAAAAPAAGHQHQPQRESNRVFKLQFDARRIISCSQNKIIVGWDFANGDPELEKVGDWSLETA